MSMGILLLNINTVRANIYVHSFNLFTQVLAFVQVIMLGGVGGSG